MGINFILKPNCIAFTAAVRYGTAWSAGRCRSKNRTAFSRWLCFNRSKPPTGVAVHPDQRSSAIGILASPPAAKSGGGGGGKKRILFLFCTNCSPTEDRNGYCLPRGSEKGDGELVGMTGGGGIFLSIGLSSADSCHHPIPPPFHPSCSSPFPKKKFLMSPFAASLSRIRTILITLTLILTYFFRPSIHGEATLAGSDTGRGRGRGCSKKRGGRGWTNDRIRTGGGGKKGALGSCSSVARWSPRREDQTKEGNVTDGRCTQSEKGEEKGGGKSENFN